MRKKKNRREAEKNLSRELLIRRGLLTVLNLLHQILLPKNENFTETETMTVMSTQAVNCLFFNEFKPCLCEPA